MEQLAPTTCPLCGAPVKELTMEDGRVLLVEPGTTSRPILGWKVGEEGEGRNHFFMVPTYTPHPESCQGAPAPNPTPDPFFDTPYFMTMDHGRRLSLITCARCGVTARWDPEAMDRHRAWHLKEESV